MGFFDILTKPEETMKALVSKANLNDALKTFAIYGAIIGIIIGAILWTIGFAAAWIIGTIPGVNTGGLAVFVASLASLGVLAIIICAILGVILSVIGSAIMYGIIWLCAKLLGGTGTFTQNYYLASKLVWPSLVAGLIAYIVGSILMIVFIGFLIILAFELYMIFVIVVLVSVANKISKLRALAAVLLPIIVVGIIAIIIAIIVALAVSSAGPTVVY
ncbi:MAG: Yip1 family protein [Candidatus Diapherotrites archaeon]|nr:Yip1 family protein [Candidatus Diapherotrites archaeon]